ncbi:MAG: hypothetical protein IJ220_06110 [Clostridia bacterium]|nr:hypothetical protein [Clostridia bacterium]
MKKIIILLVFIFLLFIPISFAEDFDTNKVNSSPPKVSNSGTTSNNAYRYWGYYKETGTRYVIRVYDWTSQKYIAVPKEYYINHIEESSNKQIMYLGVDKAENGKYKVVKSGKTIFPDNTYKHVTKWFNNSDVTKFGLTKNDVSLLAKIVKEEAIKNNDVALAKNMQDIIDGVIPYDVRAEILFLVKIPGTNGAKKTAKIVGKGSIENYSLQFYSNKEKDKSKWRKEYLTYLETRAVAYSFSDDYGCILKSEWLDKIACALYEKDAEYVFTNGTYQCSCDWYKNKFGNSISYSLVKNQIVINQAGRNPSNDGDRWYMYLTPGRCGIPVNVNGRIYYITSGKTYHNLAGTKTKVESKIKYTDMSTRAHSFDYLEAITNDATKATLYEGWDYITNKMASISIIAVDKDTGNVIKKNQVPYSLFENVNAGSYIKNAWNIDGYEYLGNMVRNDLMIPRAPLGIANTESEVMINIDNTDVENGAKKQIIFVYQKSSDKQDIEARLTIYCMQENENQVMHTGSFKIDKNHILHILINDENGNAVYNESVNLSESNTYDVDTNILEEKLGIHKEEYQYLGNKIKTHPNYYISYMGEELNQNRGKIYNLSQIEKNKVHIIIGYTPIKKIDEGNPRLKVSFIDEKGNTIPNMKTKITKEDIGKEIITMAEDMRKDMYMYIGYTYVDSLEEFAEIKVPIEIIDKIDNVKTTFERGYDRRHIAFVYKKIELEFDIDIMLVPNSLSNQLIGQVENEDYWVLDESGKVFLKVTVKGSEGLRILNYAVKLKIPFDTVMNGNLITANSINNLNVHDLSQIVIADKLTVPVWVKEGKYDIAATIEANVDGFGIVSVNKKDDVEVVGRLYDFTITNLDGSNQTGDEKWHKSLFQDEETEYKSDVIPIGQSTNQPSKYNYGIKLGTTFYFSINTKGIKNDAVYMKPKFIYISKDGKEVKEVDVYINDKGKEKNILSDDVSNKVMKLRDNNILKTEVKNELLKLQEISKIVDRYQYSTTESRNIGSLANVRISKYLSLPYVGYIDEFKNLYGKSSLAQFAKTEIELLTYVSHWYGKYVVPAASKIVDKNTSPDSKNYKDGYLIVCFNIVSLDSNGGEYLSYNLPNNITQWQKENLNQLMKLPLLDVHSVYNEVMINTLKEGYAPAIIYQVGISVLDNSTSIGTH